MRPGIRLKFITKNCVYLVDIWSEEFFLAYSVFVKLLLIMKSIICIGCGLELEL